MNNNTTEEINFKERNIFLEERHKNDTDVINFMTKMNTLNQFVINLDNVDYKKQIEEKDEKIKKLQENIINDHKMAIIEVNLMRTKKDEEYKKLEERLEELNFLVLKQEKGKNKIYCEECLNDYCNCTCKKDLL